MCPDGTMIPSFHRHDYRKNIAVDTYKEVSSKVIPDNTRYSMVDGGTDYLRRGGKYVDMTIYSDDPFEVIRRFLCRGGRGKDGDQPGHRAAVALPGGVRSGRSMPAVATRAR